MAEDIATTAHAFKKAFRDVAVTLFASETETAGTSVAFGRPTDMLTPSVVVPTTV